MLRATGQPRQGFTSRRLRGHVQAGRQTDRRTCLGSLPARRLLDKSGLAFFFSCFVFFFCKMETALQISKPCSVPSVPIWHRLHCRLIRCSLLFPKKAAMEESAVLSPYPVLFPKPSYSYLPTPQHSTKCKKTTSKMP